MKVILGSTVTIAPPLMFIQVFFLLWMQEQLPTLPQTPTVNGMIILLQVQLTLALLTLVPVTLLV